MCEQTEINYLDGDIVWVKLGSYWWPGQVVDFDKLPEEIQADYQKKQLIAVVKFFQEDSFEYVKNYQQIYKYNCTQKEDFIKKGLDKYRTKSKDGSNYMDKFPEDVKTAEILTNGDPNILISEKFSPEEKPDISGLFGEKKVPKKKRIRDDFTKKSDSDIRRRVTHLRFLQEHDHEVRIRQQPTRNLPSTSSGNSSGGIYPCYVCGFTATRVNVIICHLKNHRLNNETAATIKSKVKANLLIKSKQTYSEPSKRKYVRKSLSNKSKDESNMESKKRKHFKSIEKSTKRKKSDPELREKLLADWNIDSDEDEASDIGKSVDTTSIDILNKNQSGVEIVDDTDIPRHESSKNSMNNTDLLQESDKLLQETDSFAKLSVLKDVSSTLGKTGIDENDAEKSEISLSPRKRRDSFNFKKTNVEKSLSQEKDDKKSRLSCFDFDEDDVPEPSISSVRKIPRGLGNKNMSIKKEIIKEFEMSQALKNDAEKHMKDDDKNNLRTDATACEENMQVSKDDEDNKITANENERTDNYNQNNDEKFDRTMDICETQVEIVEIFEVEKEDEDNDTKKNETEENEDIKGLEGRKTVKPNIENKDVKKEIGNQDTVKELPDCKIVHSEVQEGINKTMLNNFEEKKMLEEVECQKLEENIELTEDTIDKEEIISREEENCSIPYDITKDDFSSTPHNSATEIKQTFYITENQEMVSNKSVAEIKDKTVLPLNATSEAQSNTDTDISSSFKSTSDILTKDDKKNILIEDNLNSPVKKRRGRPRKSLLNPEELASDNEHSKFDDLDKKIDDESDRKNSESDSDRSYCGRKRRPNRKYQSSWFDYKSSKTDESLSESDDKPEQLESKSKRVIKPRSKADIQSIENIENLNSPSNYTDDRSSMEDGIMENSNKNNMDDEEPGKQEDCVLYTEHTPEQSNYNNLKEQKIMAGDKNVESSQQNDLELLPPKKSQIKKFELSQLDIIESDIKYSDVNLNENLSKIIDDRKSDVNEVVTKATEIHSETLLNEHEVFSIIDAVNEETDRLELHNFKEKSMFTEDKSSKTLTSNIVIPKSESINEDVQTVVVQRENLQDYQHSSYQDTFIKTPVRMNSPKEERNKEDDEEEKKLNMSNTDINKTKNVLFSESSTSQSFTQIPVINNFSLADNFDSIEVIVTDNSEMNVKQGVVVSFSNDNNISLSDNSPINVENSNVLKMKNQEVKSADNLKKLDGSASSAAHLPSVPDVNVIVPVKKREKPRIIENVTLKEPMILKTKLIEKHSGKVGKHKLESDNLKLNETKGFPKTKVMKIEAVNSKTKSPSVSSNQNLVMTKRVIKTLKTDERSLISPLPDVKSERVTAIIPQTIPEVPCTEKYIQQSSQSLVDMELDINSMPFVLSEDVLTPESIEQMPVVISTLSTTLSTTLPTTLITPAKQIITGNQSFESSKDTNEVSLKKKSGTPTILKSKSKAKPTITSIKTIVPPLSSATYKGGYKVNTQALKSSFDSQKTSGKYVIVQTSGHQQAYSTHQKVVIPTSKASGNAQIVQQGSKVVILTSPQSGQPGQKMLPLNSISKAFSAGKVQRIITTKQGQQIYTSVNPQSLIGSKTVLTSKSGNLSSSPTTSKMIGHKIVNQQQIITSKSSLNQLSGSTAKSTVFTGTLPQGILTKEGIFTPINAATLGGKTIVGSKTLVTKAFSPQSISTSKNLLTPITQSFAGKTIVSKGTVLTPITGSQVKALAAKNIKGNKLQCQTIQRKIQLSGTQSSKVPISSSTTRTSTANLKTSNNIVVVSNTELKTVMTNKKGIKQTIQKQVNVSNVLSPTSVTPAQQKSKVVPSVSLDKTIASPKNINRSIKLQQKIITEKTENSIHIKPLINNEISKTKITEQQKQTGATSLNKLKNVTKTLQKKIAVADNTQTLLPSNLSTSSTVPSAGPVGYEKIPKKEILEQITSKQEISISNSQSVAVSEAKRIEEPKVSAQAQIMALPTENSDGTQTYVLVTVDEQGHIIPLDNNTLMTLDGTSNLDGSRTLYIDSSSLSDSGSMDNIVLQIDNDSLSNLQTTSTLEETNIAVSETLPPSEMTQSNSQDILAAALANTDFQHEIGVAETTASTAMTSLTQTSLINQTILQSTIIPPTEPISSPLVLETSLTLNQPIMTPLEVPSNLSIQSDLTPATRTTVPASIELPVAVSDQNISCITAGETSVDVPSNSMPEIGELGIPSKKKTTTEKILLNIQSAVRTNINDNATNDFSKPKLIDNISYSISIPENDFDEKQIQAIPSMPIIDDTFNANNGFDSSNASVVVEDNLRNFVTKTSEELIEDLTGNDSLPENETLCQETVSNDKSYLSEKVTLENAHIIIGETQDDCVSSQQNMACTAEQSKSNVENNNIQTLNEINKEILNVSHINKEVCVVSSESSVDVQSSHEVETFDVVDETTKAGLIVTECRLSQEEQTSNEGTAPDCMSEALSAEARSSKIFVNKEEENKTVEAKREETSVCHTSAPIPQDESNPLAEECKISIVERLMERRQEVSSQSYAEVSSQSVKSERWQETTQSLSYEPMKMRENVISEEPPSQSYEDSKENEASQSNKSLEEIRQNTPTQSFKELMEMKGDKMRINEVLDDPNFPTQSYEIEKENVVETMETDTELSEEGNIPSQSNDIGADGIGTSSVSINNPVLNEDETASSSYVPETPENQERDQDQESAISTSSYEIPPCEELNIASSSAMVDTSVQSEHSSIHDKGVLEIPTSSYNLNNPDSSSTHVEEVATSSYEDQIVVEQNVSTSLQTAISMGNLEERSSQNFVSDSSDERNEPTSYYSHHEEVTESYYESMCNQEHVQRHSQLEGNSEEEATPSYYESNAADIRSGSEASQSYLNEEEATPSYSNHDISASYYDPGHDVSHEASQSFYSTHELSRSSHGTLQNVEATQSFYQENSDEHQLSEQGEASSSYTDRYSLDSAYVPVSSPLDRHDVVESSVPARSMDR